MKNSKAKKKKSKRKDKHLCQSDLPRENAWTRLSDTASAPPIPNPKDEAAVTGHFGRCRALGIACAKQMDVEDPEAVFNEAYRSVILGPNPNARAWAYFPHRLRSRAQLGPKAANEVKARGGLVSLGHETKSSPSPASTAILKCSGVVS